MPHSPTASGERRSLRVPCDVLFVSPTCLCDRMTGHRLAIVTATVPPSGVTSPPERPRPDPDGGQTTAGRGTCPPESRERSGLCGLCGCRRWVPAATVSSNTFISAASASWTRLIGSRWHARCYGELDASHKVPTPAVSSKSKERQIPEWTCCAMLVTGKRAVNGVSGFPSALTRATPEMATSWRLGVVAIWHSIHNTYLLFGIRGGI